MSRRNISKENIRSIQKSKRSYYIILPIAAVRRLGWDAQQKVVVREVKKKLIVEKSK